MNGAPADEIYFEREDGVWQICVPILGFAQPYRTSTGFIYWLDAQTWLTSANGKETVRLIRERYSR